MAGKFLRGAFIEMMPTFLVPIPNIIIFQYNPETITHTWTPAQKATPPAGASDKEPKPNPLAVMGNPGESFSFTLAMDATDMLADGSPVAQGIATVSGIYTRIAALEMLLYPTGGSDGGLLGSVSASISIGGASIGGSASAGVKRNVPPAILPTVMFVWGPGRILPVKVKSLTITEKLYDKVLLNPTHAEAQIGLDVLTPEELNAVTGPLAEFAKGAYSYSQGLRQALAIANLANSVESAIGMLPI